MINNRYTRSDEQQDMRKHFFFLICIILIGLCACDNIPDCRNVAVAKTAKIEFFKSTDHSTRSIQYDSVKAESAQALFYTDAPLSKYQLALDPGVDHATFLFYLNGEADELALEYQRKMEVVSEECGPVVNFSSLRLLSHSFDSVVVVNDIIDPRVTKNIEIYN